MNIHEPNKGYKAIRPTTLKVGQEIDRISAVDPLEDDGQFAAPLGTTISEMSLPPDRLSRPFARRTFKVMKPLPADVLEGRSVPWFEQPGGGIQYWFPEGFSWYIDNGFLKEVRL